MKIIVGSINPTKIQAAQLAIDRIYPKEKIKVGGVETDSRVSAQPKSDLESIEGAINRATEVLTKTDADIAIGMEGGIEKVGDYYFECGWIAVIDRENKVGLGSTARFELSKKLAKEIFAGKEMKEVFNELTSRTDVATTDGAMGVLTVGHYKRAEAYSHGVLFAFAPFLSDPKFWD